MSQDGKKERRLSHNAGKPSQKNTSETDKTPSKNVSPNSGTPAEGESANQEREPSQHQDPRARRRATLLLSCFWMILWGIFLGVLLYAFQILPPPVLRFAVAAAAVITIIGVLIGQVIESTAIRDYFRNIWQNANQRFSFSAGLIAAEGIS